jgi:hypothetical protein
MMKRLIVEALGVEVISMHHSQQVPAADGNLCIGTNQVNYMHYSQQTIPIDGGIQLNHRVLVLEVMY